MIKKIVTASVLFSLCNYTMAEQETRINGENTQKETSKITFDGDNATITYRDGSNFTYDINAVVIDFLNIKNVISPNADGTYDMSTTSRVQLNRNNMFSVSQPVEDVLLVEGLSKGDWYKIYDTKGTLQQQGKLDSEKCEVNVKLLTKGVYMFCTAKQTIKFIKK